jgi:hypothetical protein
MFAKRIDVKRKTFPADGGDGLLLQIHDQFIRCIGGDGFE